MRSWFTAMPGEVVSCVGCHESQNGSPPITNIALANRSPAEIKPWYGPPRGFSFVREVQPVLDRYCVGCHRASQETMRRARFDLRGLEQISDYTSVYHYGGDDAGHFSTSYVALHRFIRRPGLESDYHMLTPMEFHADTHSSCNCWPQGSLRRPARRRGVGPVNHLDRLECSVSRHLDRNRRGRARGTSGRAAANCSSSMRESTAPRRQKQTCLEISRQHPSFLRR